jgi:hypothetical protein
VDYPTAGNDWVTVNEKMNIHFLIYPAELFRINSFCLPSWVDVFARFVGYRFFAWSGDHCGSRWRDEGGPARKWKH